MTTKPDSIYVAIEKYTKAVQVGPESKRVLAQKELVKALARWRKDAVIIALSKLPRQVHARHASKVELCIRPLMVKARLAELSEEKS